VDGTRPRLCSPLLLVVIVTLLSAGCSRCAEAPGYLGCVVVPDDGVLRAAWSTDPEGLDPTRYFDDIAWRAARMLFEGLTRLTPDEQVVPGVAERWESDPTFTRHTFYLRSDARWSDGTPVTAADFLFAWRRVLDPEIGAASASELYHLEAAESINRGEADPDRLGVSIEGERTLVVQLVAPDPDFARRVALPPWFPVPAHIVADDYLGWPQGNELIGNGPFRLVRWRPRDRLTASRSETWWASDEIALEGIVVHPIGDGTTVMSLYRGGDLDWVQAGTAPPDVLADRIAAGSPEVMESSSHNVYYLDLNTRRPPTDDPRVRQALGMVVPRELLATEVMGGQFPTRHFVNPGLADWDPPDIRDADVATARALLAEAGYPGGVGLPELDLVYGEARIHGLVAAFLQGVWQSQLGVRTQLVMMEWHAKEERVGRGDFHLARGGWVADLPDP